MVTGQVGDKLPSPGFVRTMVADKTTAYTAAQAITPALYARERGAGGRRAPRYRICAVRTDYRQDAPAKAAGAIRFNPGADASSDRRTR